MRAISRESENQKGESSGDRILWQRIERLFCSVSDSCWRSMGQGTSLVPSVFFGYGRLWRLRFRRRSKETQGESSVIILGRRRSQFVRRRGALPTHTMCSINFPNENSIGLRLELQRHLEQRFLVTPSDLKAVVEHDGSDVEVKHEDFLNLNPKDPKYSKIRAILLDPSCSGSGTALERLDHLLPSHNAGFSDHSNVMRLKKLAGFQKKVLEHALSFPGLERIVYSTCSIHQTENEDVVESVLDIASSNGFQLATAFPQWPRRGLPTFDGSEHLLRTDMAIDKEGFFIALFIRTKRNQQPDEYEGNHAVSNHVSKANTSHRRSMNVFTAKMLKVFPSTRFKLYRKNAKVHVP